MIEIPVYDVQGNPVDTLSVDEALLGGEVRPALLKQAYVRFHANRRQGSAKTKSRSEVAFSTRKLFKQKGTGGARRGSAGTNIMRKGGMAHAKRPKSWRADMPIQMRRLANRNALLAKAVDGEIKLVAGLTFEAPSTRQFANLLTSLKIDRTCLIAFADTRGPEALSAKNLDHVSLTHIDRLNAFDLLNHRYLLTDKATLQSWLDRAAASLASAGQAANEGEAN